MSDISEKLKNIQLFKDVRREACNYIIEEGRLLDVDKGTEIFAQDDESDERFYVVVTGEVGIEKFMRNEDEIVNNVKPGDFFGELALYSGEPRKAGATVLESGKVLEITRSTLGKVKAEYPEELCALYENMFEVLAGRFDSLAQKAEKTQFWL